MMHLPLVKSKWISGRYGFNYFRLGNLDLMLSAFYDNGSYCGRFMNTTLGPYPELSQAQQAIEEFAREKLTKALERLGDASTTH